MSSTPPKPAVSPLKASTESVTSVHHWTDKLLSFRSTRPAGYQFTPGQFARLGVTVGEEVLWRAYSVTSATSEPELEYFLVQVPGGQFTEHLKSLQPGMPILVEKFSYGFMTADRFVDGEDLWMLATGTGLGPFISILQDPAVWQKFRNLILVHCVRNADELAYQELLTSLPSRPELAAGGARLRLLRSTTRDVQAAAPGNLQGRITALLANGALEAAAGLDITVEKSRIMMCGNPEMITETRELLHQRGLRPCRRAVPGQFVTEDYW
ncbi:oxidoreductase NAD-binding domain protein [Collimonas arenae]|uniref:ferredoxin--NADP(+) reductase n=1 Tax=Collimonas arenae TaxID=279058 RepID=A0A127PPY9_9BURK|nr:ferredoxin--NADP reductase [Collimonas arenae]AMO99870.1 oxidoreductase NAD-binding domain protein [Collimonas arenae]AMP09767.1 oxidoreductase NAD-binding domain protein [Collimonas arenae]